MKELIKKILKEEYSNICGETTIYFAHPINTYGSEIESKAIQSIENKFINSTIINPGEQKYQDEFIGYRENNPQDYMKYFKDLVNECSVIVYLPFTDGMIGAGIRYEVYQLNKKFDSIYEINPNDYSIRKVDMTHVDNQSLSVEETRGRIKIEY